MATTFNATKVSSAALLAMPGVGDGQSAKVVAATYTVTAGAALVINDLIQSPMIQAGSVITDVMVVVDDLDTSTGITLDVGYGVDPDYFVAASTIGQTGGVVRASAATAHPLVLTTNDTIDVLVKAAPTTGTTTYRISIIVTFTPLNA